MTDDERSLAALLRASVPEGLEPVTFDEVVRVRRSRRRVTIATVAGAVAVVVVSAALVGSNLPGEDTGPTAAQQGTDEPISPISSAPSEACPPTEPYPNGQVVMIDYVPFIQLDGRQFIADMLGNDTTTRKDLGDQVATVTCTIADLTEDGTRKVTGSFLEGNAAFLPVGTPIYAVDGFDAACRVAVVQTGTVSAYLAQHEVNHRSVPLQCATGSPDSLEDATTR